MPVRSLSMWQKLHRRRHQSSRAHPLRHSLCSWNLTDLQTISGALMINTVLALCISCHTGQVTALIRQGPFWTLGMGHWLCSCAESVVCAAVTNYHTLSSLKQYKFCTLQFRKLKNDVSLTRLKTRCQPWCMASKGHRREFPHLFQLLEAPHSPWFMASFNSPNQ